MVGELWVVAVVCHGDVGVGFVGRDSAVDVKNAFTGRSEFKATYLSYCLFLLAGTVLEFSSIVAKLSFCLWWMLMKRLLFRSCGSWQSITTRSRGCRIAR